MVAEILAHTMLLVEAEAEVEVEELAVVEPVTDIINIASHIQAFAVGGIDDLPFMVVTAKIVVVAEGSKL